MYCPACGKEISSGLSFCNFCGLRLNAPESDPNVLSASSFNLLVGAVIAIPIFGLGLIIAMMAAMKNGLGFRDDMIFVVVFMTFLLLFITEVGTLMLMISRTRKPKVKQKKEPAASEPRSVSAIGDVEIKGLNASSFDGIPSVTEHTTRTLDAAYRRNDDRK